VSSRIPFNGSEFEHPPSESRLGVRRRDTANPSAPVRGTQLRPQEELPGNLSGGQVGKSAGVGSSRKHSLIRSYHPWIRSDDDVLSVLSNSCVVQKAISAKAPMSANERPFVPARKPVSAIRYSNPFSTSAWSDSIRFFASSR
jgi:hypothetical protein